jgi:hypothetical protein
MNGEKKIRNISHPDRVNKIRTGNQLLEPVASRFSSFVSRTKR